MKPAIRPVCFMSLFWGASLLLCGPMCVVALSQAGEPNEPAVFDESDFGDAPDDANTPGYPTLLIHNGARHALGGPWFGGDQDRPDAEADGQPDPNARGDDANESDDENGVTVPPLYPGQPAIITLDVQGGGVVQAWIDFNGNWTWQPEEKIFDGLLPDGPQAFAFGVPEDAKAGKTFARFRISSGGGLGPDGSAADGEVEDHVVFVEEMNPDFTWLQWPDVTQSGTNVRVDGNDLESRWLADDFNSVSQDRMVGVRLWGSWKGDRKGTIRTVNLAIYLDDPAGPDGVDPNNMCAEPGAVEPLWTNRFDPNDFTEKPYLVVRAPGEWWQDPEQGQSLSAADMQIWQIDIPVRCGNAFKMAGSPEKPITYWLALRVEAEGGQFGWTSRQWPYRDKAGAVWSVGSEASRAWEELRYPDLHPYYGRDANSTDLAFCLEFSPEPCGGGSTWTMQPISCPTHTTCTPALCPTYTTCTCPTTHSTCICPPPPTVDCPTTWSCPTFSCPTLNCPTLDCPTLNCPTLNCPTLNCPTLACPTLNCPTLSCPTLDCPTLSCPTLDCPTLSCPTFDCPTLSCPTLDCPTLSCPTLDCPTLSCPTLSCPTLGCPFQARGNRTTPLSSARPVVYTLQKDWLITDHTCPAIKVDCPTVVPQTIKTSGGRQPAEQPRISRSTTDKKMIAGS